MPFSRAGTSTSARSAEDADAGTRASSVVVSHLPSRASLIAAGIDASPTFAPFTSLNSSLRTKVASEGGRLMIRQTAFAVTMSFGLIPPPSGVKAPA